MDIHKESLEKSIVIIEDYGISSWIASIVANQVMEKTKKPTMIFSKKWDSFRGSIRNLWNIDLKWILKKHWYIMKGHNTAWALYIPIEDWNNFKSVIIWEFDKFKPEDYVDSLKVDSEISSWELTEVVLDQLNPIKPSWQKNRAPCFLLKWEVIEVSKFTKKTWEVVNPKDSEDVVNISRTHTRVRLKAWENIFSAIIFMKYVPEVKWKTNFVIQFNKPFNKLYSSMVSLQIIDFF